MLFVLFDYTTLLISYTHNGDDTHKDTYIRFAKQISWNLPLTISMYEFKYRLCS